MARIAVVGDVMLDVYLHCSVAGFSPEDDLAPKLVVQSRSHRPGGAANVACCLGQWGSRVGLFGVTGNDFSCETLSSLFRKDRLERVYLPALLGRPTTCKTRVVTPKYRQVVRVDEESHEQIPEHLACNLYSAVAEFNPDVIVVSDYAKGVVTRDLMDRLRSLDVLTVVDPKQADFLHYGAVFAITPNRKEYSAFENSEHTTLAKHLIVTDAEHGSFVLCGKTLFPEFLVSVRKRELGDPAGCGDSFLAALVHSLCVGQSLRQACLAASAAGALAFDLLGVACPTWEQIEQELSNPEYRIKEIEHGKD